MSIHRLAVILARAGSKGLPNKNVLTLAGRPMIAYTIDDAQHARSIDGICVTTDAPQAAEVARREGVFVVERPESLASDTATVDSAARHAVERYEESHGHVTHVVILYANVPIRPPHVIDHVLDHLIATGADSVRSLAPVSKQHPDWLHKLDGDRMIKFRENTIYRRQDLEPLYYHDGAALALTRNALFTADPNDAHACMGRDRRGVVSQNGFAIDIDSISDLHMAEAIIRNQDKNQFARMMAPPDQWRTEGAPVADTTGPY